MANIINIGLITIGTASPRLEDLEVTPTTSQQTFESDEYYGYKTVTVDAVTSSVDENIQPENIVNGVNILGVTGSADALKGQTKTVSPTTSQQEITPDSGYNAMTKVTVEAVTKDIDSDIQASNIKEGVTILGVEGNVKELVGQEKIINPSTTSQVIEPDTGYNGITKATVNAVTSSIDPEIQAGNIKQGVEILGVTGNVVELNGQVKIVNPSTSAQTIRPDANKNAITEVTVNPVTSSIDNNIQAGNVKSGVSILGVNGNVIELVGQTKSVTPTSQVQTITPDAGYNGLTEVTVGASQGDPSEYFYNTTYSYTGSTSGVGTWHKLIKKIVVHSFPTGMTSLSNLFGQYQGQSIVFDNFDTSKIVNMNQMFYNSPSLTTLDLSSFDTSNVTDMGDMFRNCQALTSLDLSSFVTSKVTTMNGMFRDCRVATSINTSNFITTSVTNMGNMFYNCYALTGLDLRNFNTTIVTNMGSMFRDCRAATNIDVSSFSTSVVTSMSNMFYNCYALISLDLSNFSISSVTSMEAMFFGCSSLQTLDISGMDFGTYGSQITSSNIMFGSVPSGCTIYVKDQASKDWLDNKFSGRNFVIK